LLKAPIPRAAPAALVLCWPQTFKELLASVSPLSVPASLPKAGAKVQLFSLRATLFFVFLKLFYIILTIKYLKTMLFSQKHKIQGVKPSFSAQKSIFWPRFSGKFSCF